jgi:hypothetical protein
MRQKSDKIQQPGNKGAEALYLENIALAQKAEQSGNIILSQTFYQKAEYYLYATKEHTEVPISTIHTSTTKSPRFRETQAIEKHIQKNRHRKASYIDPSDRLYGAQNECTILPFKSK